PPQGMVLIRIHGMRLDVAGETDLEGDAPIVDVLRERLILEQPRGVSNAIGAADVHRIANRSRAGAFAGVTGAREIMRMRVLERREVQRRRIAVLAARQIEADNAAVTIRHRELRQLERLLRGHRANTTHDDAADRSTLSLGPRETAQWRLDGGG